MPPFTMEKETILDERGSSGCDSLSPGDDADRCFTDNVAAQDDQGKLETQASLKRYKYLGATSSVISSEALWASPTELPYSHQNGQ